jgi:hypothetical protein
MKKIILGYIIPISIIVAIAGYFIYLKFQAPKSEVSYYELQWALFKDNWLLCLIGIVAYLYMQIIVPKIFKK